MEEPHRELRVGSHWLPGANWLTREQESRMFSLFPGSYQVRTETHKTHSTSPSGSGEELAREEGRRGDKTKDLELYRP